MESSKQPQDQKKVKFYEFSKEVWFKIKIEVVLKREKVQNKRKFKLGSSLKKDQIQSWDRFKMQPVLISNQIENCKNFEEKNSN